LHPQSTALRPHTGKMGYTIAAPDEYLAITGMSVKLVKICKKAWVWPAVQKCTRFR
jgi:flotillin